jgi:hypothetical protein
VVLVLLGALLSLVPGLTGARLWVSDYGYDQTLYAFDKATGKLGVDQL